MNTFLYLSGRAMATLADCEVLSDIWLCVWIHGLLRSRVFLCDRCWDSWVHVCVCVCLSWTEVGKQCMHFGGLCELAQVPLCAHHLHLSPKGSLVQFSSSRKTTLINYPSSGYFSNSQHPEHMPFTSKLANALLKKMCPQSNSYGLVLPREPLPVTVWKWDSRRYRIPSRQTHPAECQWVIENRMWLTGRWRGMLHDTTPSTRWRRKFSLSLGSISLSVMGLWVSFPILWNSPWSDHCLRPPFLLKDIQLSSEFLSQRHQQILILRKASIFSTKVNLFLWDNVLLKKKNNPTKK